MASNSFKTAIRSSEREINGYVEIYDGSIDLKTGDTITGTEASCSVKNQIIDNIRMPINYASFEQDYFEDDGMILPNNPTSDNINIGYISNVVSDNDGLFSVNPNIKITLSNTTNSINGITIYFRKGYPINFNIILTNISDITETKNITNNENEVYHLIENITNLKSIEIETLKWSEPNRRVRISEVDFEISDMFEKGLLIDFQVTEQVSKLSLEMPKNEVVVNLSNIDKRFDYINPNGIAKFLTEGLKIKSYIGCLTAENGMEYIDMGYFYLTEWRNDNDMTTKLTGLNLLNKLSKEKSYDRNPDGGNEYMPYIFPRRYFEFLCNRWGLSYIKDDELPTHVVNDDEYYTAWTLTDGNLPNLTKLEQLHQLSITGFGNIFINRDNVLCFLKLPIATSDTVYLNNMKSYPVFTLKNQLKQINWNDTVVTAGDIINDTIYTGTHQINGTKDIYIEFDNPVFAYDISVTSGVVNSYFNGGYFIKINITADNDTDITITGRKDIASIETHSYIYNDTGEVLQISNDLLGYLNYMDSYLGDSLVTRISDFINNNYDNYNVNIDWFQDPTIKAGDLISIETPFGFKDIFVEKQVFRYNGALDGFTEGVGN